MNDEFAESEDFEPDPDSDEEQFPEGGDTGQDEEEGDDVVPPEEEEDG